MRQQLRIAAIVMTAGLCASASAQDSISTSGGNLPGDALNPWIDNCTAYVVDLSPITTPLGHTFGVAPVLKMTQTNSTNFNNLYSASTISPSTRTNTLWTRSDFNLWENTPGAGVHPKMNMPGNLIPAPSDAASNFAVAISEFGTTDAGTSFNGIIGAFINYDPADPNRLYVDRRQAAVNSVNEIAGDDSQLGGLSIDANGNLFFRADNNNSTGANQISNNNIFRTRLMDRNCAVPNVISMGGTDATDALITNFGGTPFGTPKLGVPNSIPARIAGGDGLSVGTNAFDATSDMFVGDTGAFTQSPLHLDTTGGIGGDHRGAFGSTTHDFLGNGADYTFAILAKDAQAGSGETRIYNVTSVDATGLVIAARGFEIPLSIADNGTGFIVNYTGNSQPQNYTSSTLYRGGVGQLAIGRDQAGRGLMAATVTELPGVYDSVNQIAVCRYNAATGLEEWALAAYIDFANIYTPNAGKPILDSTGAIIGQLVHLDAINGVLGLSMSAPAIDSVGNIWFMSAVELFNRIDLDGDGIPESSDFDGAVIRAIYDPATFSYELDLVLEVGQVISGLNSGRDYRIDFLGSSAANGRATPSTIYSSNVAEFAWNNSDVSAADTSDPITNGGLFFGTSITYDTDQDGRFNNPTSAFYDPTLPADESYSVGLYVGYYDQAAPPCPADMNGDGVVGFPDVSAFVAAFQAGDPAADFNGDGVIGFPDVSAFVAAFQAGCP